MGTEGELTPAGPATSFKGKYSTCHTTEKLPQKSVHRNGSLQDTRPLLFPTLDSKKQARTGPRVLGITRGDNLPL